MTYGVHMTTSKQIARFVKRSMFKGVDPYNTLDAAMQLRAQDNARRNRQRKRADHSWHRELAILRHQAA